MGIAFQRFEILQAQWSSFLSEFLPFRSHTLSNVDPISNPNISTAACEESMSNDSQWATFKTKWHIPESMTYSSLLSHTSACIRSRSLKTNNSFRFSTESTLLVISKNPLPKIQQITLMTMPNEIIDLIMGHATLERALLLSSTCRLMRPMGLRIIFSVSLYPLTYLLASKSSHLASLFGSARNA